ncbi:MAG: MFS transporter, partial [Muribaculum sp.]|nr:MFS transporter [Muribaculum sp.]
MDTETTQLIAPKRYYRIAVGVFFFLQGFTFASWAARIPDFKAIFSLSDGVLGTLLFAFPFGQLLGVPIAGY